MKVLEGYPLPLGATLLYGGNSVQISVHAKDEKECRLHLYKSGKKYKTISMPSMVQYGAEDVFSVCLSGEDIVDELSSLAYTFEAGGKEFVDPYARKIYGRDVFGQRKKERAGFLFETFDWTGENRKTLTYAETIMYQCHVRGFTKHSSSGVLYPGTFSGIIEKIPYLKGLGVNTLLLLPIYDFDEMMESPDGKKKVNYWGYADEAYYFAPKASYGTGQKSSATECKEMVKALHTNGMNVLFDMHFVGKTPDFILECLRYYVTEFHADGFLLNQNHVGAELVMNDPILRNVKLLGTGWPELAKENREIRLGCFNDGFMVDARKFLKSDEGMVGDFYQRFKAQGNQTAVVNYITQKNGFTLKDLVSYDVKHNEQNGERNKDGTEYNYSWNCGAEGVTRRKTVLAMREQQVKNAFAMLLLSVGTPMLLAGDEFGNSQKGNNNAYCQDNAITWLNWGEQTKHEWLTEYVRELIQIRKKYGVYDGRTLRGMDYKGVGAPDVSCHSIEPWVSGFVNYSRELGVLFYKTYIDSDSSLYIAMNMHWEPHTFYLPDVDFEGTWNVLLDTSGKGAKEVTRKPNQYVMDPRTIAVFQEIPGSDKKN